MKSVISIDPALKNLAVVKITFDDDDTSIIDIEPKLIDIMKIKKPSFEKVLSNLKSELDKIETDDVDYVLVENQPSKLNPRVKSVAVAIYTYFMINKKPVFFVNPSTKFTKDECKLPYAARKKKSVENTLLILNENQREIINEFSKADDICDCILLANAWLKRN